MKYIPILLLFFACTPQPQQAIQSGFILTIDGRQYTASGNMNLTPVGTVPPKDTVIVPPIQPPTGSNFQVGLNSHPWINPTLFAPIKLQRQYVSSYYFWTGLNGKIRPQPFIQAETATARGLDDVLNNAKAAGVVTLLTIHQTPTWFLNQNRGDGGGDYAPVQAGKSRLDTNSYREYALALQQIARRYGPKKYADKDLNIDENARWPGDGNVRKSGLNILTYIEPWNESAKWWKIGTAESQSYMTAEETACLMSMCYDYIKPTGVKVVMPGLPDYDWPYVLAMGEWFKKNRKDGKWPCDVFNLHHYQNTGNEWGNHPANWNMAGGCLPAQDKNFGQAKLFADFAHKMGMPFWLSETGFDTGGNSPMQFPGGEVAVGEAIEISLKAYQAAGVDAVFLFSTADEFNATQGLYQTSGLFKGQDKNYASKASFSVVSKYAQSLQSKAMQQPVGNIDRTKQFVIPPNK